MSNYKEAQLVAFRSELRKMAWSVPRVLGPASAAAGVGMGVGGVVGGGYGAIKGYHEARDQGATAGQAAMAGLGGAVTGGGKGALIGAGTGAVAGAAHHVANPVAAEKLRSSLTNHSSFARFGQRQAHGLTGYTPEGGLAAIRHGAAPRLEAVTHAKGQVARADAGEDVRSMGQKILGRDSKTVAKNQLESAEASHAAAQKAEDMGLTSIPGYVRSLKNNGVGNTLKASLKDQWAGSSLGMKGLMVGLPAAELGHAAFQDPNTLNERGRTRGQAVGEAAAGLGSGLFMSPLPVVTQMLSSVPTMAAGRQMGKVVDRRSRQAGQVVPAQAGGV